MLKFNFQIFFFQKQTDTKRIRICKRQLIGFKIAFVTVLPGLSQPEDKLGKEYSETGVGL